MANKFSATFHIPEPYYLALFEAISGNNVLVKADAPKLTILAATPSYLKETGYTKDAMIGKGVFEAFPVNADPAYTGGSELLASYEHVILHKEAHVLPAQRYDLKNGDGTFTEKYWRISNKPVLSPDGEVAYIIHTSEDITDQLRAQKRESQLSEIEKAFGLFMDAPMVVGLVMGDDYVLEMANRAAFKLWGKGSEIIGKPILQGLPELVGQGIIELFDQVRTTGQPCTAKELYVTSYASGQPTSHYFDIIYQPYYGNNSNVATGVFTISYDVTGVVEARKKLEQKEAELRQSEQNLRSIIQQAPVAMIIFKGENLVFDTINPAMLELLDKTEEIVGKPLHQVLPEVKDQPIYEILSNVYRTGQPSYGNEWLVPLVRNGKLENRYFNFAFTSFTENGQIAGVMDVATEVTEQVAIRKKIQDSHKELQFVMDIMPTMVWHTLPNGYADYFNQGFQDYTGLSQEQLKGDLWVNLLHPDDVEATGRIWQQALVRGDRYEVEHRLRGEDGGYHWFLTRGVPLKDEGGQTKKWYGTSTNVQEQKTAAEILKTVTANTTLGLFMLDNDRNCIYMNEAAEKMTGFTFKEMKGKNLHHQIHHSHRDGSPYPLEQCPLVCALPMGEQIQGEELFIHSDGRFYPVAFTASPILLNGVALGTVLEVRDITEEKRREQERTENEPRFRLMANSLPLVIWTASPDGQLTFISDQWEEEFGNPISESLGTGWVRFVHPDDIDHAARVWAHSLQSEKDYETEFRVMHKSGEYRWLLVRAIPIHSADGDIVQWYGSNTDIQEKKLFEDQLERRVKQRTQEMEQFTYVSHHDLQEPLRKITMFTDMVKSDSYEKLSEASQKRLDRVRDAAQRMSQALRDVLNFASLNKEEQFSDVDLEEVLAAVTNDLELVIQEKGAKLFAEELPNIRAVPVQMHQLLYNLVNNALKFSKPDQPPVIKIRCKIMTSTEVRQHPELNEKKRYHLISVEDNGIGFSEEHREKIFSLFQRLHSKSDYAGTGIGLALVRKVAMNHEGKVWAESTPGEGATFNMLLPIE